MSALESLSNPLERIATLPTTVNARKSAPGDIFWDVGVQYFANDIVLSTVNGGAYIFTGGASDAVSTRGGSDPALDPTNWTRLQGDGLANIDTFTTAAPILNAGVGAAYVIPAGAILTVPATSAPQLWMCNISGSISTQAPPPPASTAADVTIFTFTGNGVGGGVKSITCVPIDDGAATTTNVAYSCPVIIGTGGTSITPTAVTGSASAPTQLNTSFTFTYTRIA